MDSLYGPPPSPELPAPELPAPEPHEPGRPGRSEPLGGLHEHLAWLRLALAPGLGPRLAARAVARAGGAAQALRRPLSWWRALAGSRAEALERHPAQADPEPVLAQLAGLGAEALTPAQAGWPVARLAALSDPPPALFLRGRLPAAAQRRVALVGTRAASSYGLRVARELGEALARRGVCVVSGLALGIDAAAHAGALAAGVPGCATLAVLGSGLACCYPPENAALAEAVAGAGGLLSEFPPEQPPERWQFPRRNRLVAALAEAVVVVEAPLRSGALLTAQEALEQGREVLAVPGPVGRPSHEGAHALLRQQAASICTGVEDVLAALGLGSRSAAAGARSLELPEPVPPPAGPQLALWQLLDADEARDADRLCRDSGLPPEEVAAALTALELAGRARRLPGVGYLRA
ncbi:MAG: DNA-processing protein DprA [Planctomycetia bacterium]